MSDELEPEALARLFEDAFARVFRGEVENDDFNRLVLRAGLAADDIVVLRAYAKYCKQIGFALSQATIEATLAAQPHIARMLVKLFRLRLHPQRARRRGAAAQVHAIELALDRVSNLNEDRVLRQLLALVQATLRTNYWRTGVGHSRRGRAAAQLPQLQARFGQGAGPARARGRCTRSSSTRRASRASTCAAARWRAAACAGRDRPEDFRTEVLGLVKAQMVKNTVIVPVGTKGGFVLKKAPPASDREAYLKEGVACYQDYLRALLDLTDNLVGGQVVPPPLVRRLDGDDPYLVVAADKGTATFSDHRQRHLAPNTATGWATPSPPAAASATTTRRWASPRAAPGKASSATSASWASTRRARTSRVVGIGDMSGDVFGNGMLLSRHIRLVAAFDHRHVFIDPTPTPAASFAERERLFKLPRSSWADYDASLISAGGGVWSRAREVDPAVAAGARGARHRGRAADAGGAAQRHPEGAGGPALQRRHRHLRQGRAARAMPRSATAPTTRCASTAASCAARWWPKAATWAARSSAASRRRWPACASTPMPSTTRPASTPPTTRSTSRSCSAWPWPTAR